MSAVVETARLWLDTPYMHQHATRGRGCDCLGLIRGVWRDLFGSEPETPPAYTPHWGDFRRDEILIDALGRWMVTSPGDMPGDVLVFRMRSGHIAKHCAIRSGDDKMIHAYQGANRVTEHHIGKYWQSRLVASFRYPEV